MKLAVVIGVLKEKLPGKLLTGAHNSRDPAVGEIDLAELAAFALKAQMNDRPFYFGVTIAQRRQAIGAIGSGVFFVADADQRAVEEGNHRGDDFFSWQAGQSEVAGNALPQARQCLAKGTELVELGAAGIGLPVGVINVLLSAFGIAARRL